MSFHFRWAACAALVFIPFYIHGAEQDDEGTVIVTATRTPQSADEALTQVIVIDRTEIEAAQAHDVAELLRLYAGIEVARNGGPGQATSAFVRGTESNHVLVLMDGVKINPATIGGAPLQDLDPALIERIEIVKGPYSGLYGSEAIGGVIQIFTHSPRKTTRLNTRITGGSFGTARLHTGIDGPMAGIHFAAENTRGFPPRQESTLDRGYENTSFSGYITANAGPVDLTLRHWGSQGNTEYLDFFLTPLDQNFREQTTALSVEGGQGDWTHMLRLSRMLQRVDQNQPNFLGQFDFFETDRKVLEWQGDWQMGTNQLLTLGAAVTRERATARSFGTSFDEDIDIREVYVQDQLRWGRNRLEAVMRYTDHDAFGGHTTGALKVGRDFSPQLRGYLSAGTGFRAPDATDRFGYGGNPYLEPEENRNLEAGLRWQPGDGQRLDAAVFDNRIRNLIAFVDPDGFLGPLPGRNENVDRARIYGLELTWTLRHGPWRWRAGGVLQNPRNEETHRELARRAKSTLTLAGEYIRDHWRVGIDILATDWRYDSDFSDTRLSGYTLVNARGSVRIAPDTWLRLRVENIFDRGYELADTYNTAGRSFYLTLDYTGTQ